MNIIQKFVLTVAISFFLVNSSFGQVTLIDESFESGLGQFFSSGNDLWKQNDSIVHSGNYAIHLAYSNNSQSYLTLDTAIDLNSYAGGLLEFFHIAKVEVADYCLIQISDNNGTTWDTLQQNNYLGQGFLLNDHSFFDGSYVDWYYNDNISPTNSWWKKETFDISKYCGSGSNQVKVRFMLNSDGLLYFYGWIIDDIKITATTNGELTPPTIEHYPIKQSSFTVPITIHANISDSSGIDSALVYYRIDTGSWTGPNEMDYNGGIDYSYTFPGQPVGTTINYFIKAVDATPFHNTAFHPFNEPVNYHSFSIISAINSYPYHEDFEGVSANQWYHKEDLTVGNTGVNPYDDWELGYPGKSNFSPHSGSYAYVTQLYSQYTYNSRSSLISPLFDLSVAVNPVLSFYHKLSCSYNDGARIDYTTDEGITWTVLGYEYDNKGVNWYNQSAIGSASTPVERPGWSYGQSYYWIKSSYQLQGIGWPDYFVRFRFVFTSDWSSGNGWLVDDISIEATVSVPEAEKDTHFFINEIFPNPAGDIVNISFYLKEMTDINIKVVSLMGKIVKEFSFNNFPSGNCHQQIDLTGLTNGPYIIQFSDGNQLINKMIQVMKEK